MTDKDPGENQENQETPQTPQNPEQGGAVPPYLGDEWLENIGKLFGLPGIPGAGKPNAGEQTGASKKSLAERVADESNDASCKETARYLGLFYRALVDDYQMPERFAFRFTLEYQRAVFGTLQIHQLLDAKKLMDRGQDNGADSFGF